MARAELGASATPLKCKIGIIANQLIELAKAGERNPDRLCEGALEKLREHLFGD